MRTHPDFPPSTLYLSVVMPAYNEEQRLGPTLERVLSYLDQQPFPAEIVVVMSAG